MCSSSNLGTLKRKGDPVIDNCTKKKWHLKAILATQEHKSVLKHAL